MPGDQLGEGGQQLLEELVLRPGRGEAHLGLEGERGQLLSAASAFGRSTLTSSMTLVAAARR
jgi:hypothetical protein